MSSVHMDTQSAAPLITKLREEELRMGSVALWNFLESQNKAVRLALAELQGSQEQHEGGRRPELLRKEEGWHRPGFILTGFSVFDVKEAKLIMCECASPVP